MTDPYPQRIVCLTEETTEWLYLLDIASALVRRGVQVTVFNQRSVDEIFSMLWQVAALVGQAKRGQHLIEAMRARLAAIGAAARALPRRPRVYFEEWDEPPISAIRIHGPGPRDRRCARTRPSRARPHHRLLVRQEVSPREGGGARGLGRSAGGASR